VDGDDVILEIAPGVEARYMKRAIMDVVSPAETPEEEVAPVDEYDEPAEPAEPVADGTAEPTDTVPESAADAEEDTAYEQATGTKKD